jgi:transcriptional regulator with XRE-family HTH domain
MKGDMFGDRIRLKRKELGWTLAIAARRTALSKSFLSDLETGRKRPSADTLRSLAAAFGVSMDWLMYPPRERAGEEDGQVVIPKELAWLGDERNLPTRTVMLLLALRYTIAIHRREPPTAPFNWLKFYEAIKDFLR